MFIAALFTAFALLLLLLSRFSRVWLCATPQTAAHQAPSPWDSPGKNTGVGCHFLLQCMKVKSEREVAQSCPALSDPMDCSLPGSSIHGNSQARVLEWGAIAFSKSTGVESKSSIPPLCLIGMGPKGLCEGRNNIFSCLSPQCLLRFLEYINILNKCILKFMLLQEWWCNLQT